MTALSPEERAHFEALLNEYEKMREDAQDGLKAVVGDLREKLTGLVAKEDVADELAGFRLYVKRRYAQENHPEKVAKADAKSEIADAYEFQASQDQVYTTRTRSAGRASQTPHDASAGEIIEASATVADRGTETVPTAEGGSPSPITEIAEEIEASVSATNSHGASGAVPEASSVAPAPQAPERPHDQIKASEATPSTIDTTQARTTVGAAPGKPVELSEKAKASRAKAIAAGYVLSDEPFEPKGVPIPDFIGNTDQVGRA